MRIRALLFATLAVIAWSGAWSASAVAESGKPAAATARVTIPDPSTREAAAALVSGMDDRQARALLLQKLGEDADRVAARATGRDTRTLGDLAKGYLDAAGAFLIDVVRKVPSIPAETARTLAHFGSSRGDRSPMLLWASLIASLAGGGIAAWLAGRIWPLPLAALPTSDPGRWTSARSAALALVRRLALVGAFVVGAHLVNHAVNTGAESDRLTGMWVIAVVGWSAFAWTVIQFVLAPSRPQARLGIIEDTEARFLARRLMLAVLVFNIGFGFASWLNRFGLPFNAIWLGFWVNLVFHILLVATVWQGRRGIAQLCAGSTDREVVHQSMLARNWPSIMIGLIVLHWLIVELIVATSDVPLGLFAAMASTLAILVALPLFDQALASAVAAFLPVDDTRRPALVGADESTRRGLRRVARIAGLALLIVGFLRLWGVDVVTLAEQGVGARFASSIINLLAILGLAYGFWELVRIVTDRQIAHERVALGLDVVASEETETEGSGTGARLGTLLPLVRLAAEIVIVVLTGFAVLGEIGVNIWPLLAGAGVVGLAVGFGAQALVKDIISGIFFLIDDAFRKGEYIDIGSVKGTVERISLRSMQLRHHNGPLNTVPFGDIRHVTNYSRDWVVMKLSLRLTYDTDAEKVRKMIKRLGEELLADEELGPKFLQPLKSQGVIEMADSAMIMSVKFMTRPNDQWVVRRVVFNRIRELFQNNGIRFASREVVVRVEGSGADGGSEHRVAAAAAAESGRLDAEATVAR